MDLSPDKQYRLEDLMPMIQQTLAEGRTVVIRPRGTSMLPLIRQGKDSVELSALPERLKKYDLPLYQRPNGQYVLHRIVKAGETFTCIGDGQFQKETGVEQAWMIARVTAVYREGKRVSTTSFSYWLYCRLWHWSRPVRHLIWRVRQHRKRSQKQ